MRKEESKPRLAGHMLGLDGVRGLAILMVMALHFVGDATAQSFLQSVIVKVASYGLLGVDLFFVLSGFLITGILLDSKGRPGYFRNFYARRTLRIFPLYYGVLAVVFLILPLFTTLSPMLEHARVQQGWLWTYTANFYVAYKGSWSSLTYMTHFWSLAIEEHFYLVWPVVVYMLRRETLERVCVAIILTSLSLRIWLALTGVSDVAISVLTPCRIDTLCVGGLLAIVARRDGGLQMLLDNCRAAALGLGAFIVILSAYTALSEADNIVLYQIRTSFFAFFFGALTLVSLRPETEIVARIFRWQIMRFFGKYSYGLYVYHGMLTWYFAEVDIERKLDTLLGNHWLAIGSKAALGVSVSLLVAVLSYEFFEKRFLMLKRYFEAPKATSSMQPASARKSG